MILLFVVVHLTNFNFLWRFKSWLNCKYVTAIVGHVILTKHIEYFCENLAHSISDSQ
jgi:hypothetical protein